MENYDPITRTYRSDVRVRVMRVVDRARSVVSRPWSPHSITGRRTTHSWPVVGAWVVTSRMEAGTRARRRGSVCLSVLPPRAWRTRRCRIMSYNLPKQ